MKDEDYDFHMDELTNGEIRKYLYLFEISIAQVMTEFSIWMSMSNEEKEDYEDDFSWYLGSKYQGRVS